MNLEAVIMALNTAAEVAVFLATGFFILGVMDLIWDRVVSLERKEAVRVPAGSSFQEADSEILKRGTIQDGAGWHM